MPRDCQHRKQSSGAPGKGDSAEYTAVGRVRRYRNGKDKRAPAPLKACPWCGTPFTKNSFACRPNETAPTNLEIRCDLKGKLPTLHFSELLAIAYNTPIQKGWFAKHLVDPMPLLKSRRLIA